MRKLVLLIIVALSASQTQAQININLTNIEEWVKTNFVGQGVVVGNIKVSLAANEAGGIFLNNGVLKLNKGLVLSTGDVRRIAGLNDKHDESTGFNWSGKAEEDKDLQKILKGAFYDVSFIEFDFVPYNNSIAFNYQFGSDEYPEFVGSAFNDVFAFIVSDGQTSTNIALIPDKKTPVSINTVNFKTDSAYFIDNNVFTLVNQSREQPKPDEEIYRSNVGKMLLGIKMFFVGQGEQEKQYATIEPSEALIKKVNDKLYRNFQYDGITKKLVAQTFVEPYKKYHLKIIIADVSDNIYDSGVFLEQGSFATKKDITQLGFVDYPDLSKQIDVKRILNGEKLQDIIEPTVKESTATNQIITSTKSKTNLNNVVIYFDFDEYDIKDSEVVKIKYVAQTFATLGNDYTMEVIGHTDNKGNLGYNMSLSDKRSKSVIECFQSINTKIKNTSISNKAYLNPVVSNETDEGRALNRRVEIRFIKIK
jgi:outer membrane protein OmpA-like peptidoglycan-associated protein